MKITTKAGLKEVQDLFTELKHKASINSSYTSTLKSLVRAIKRSFELNVTIDIIPVTSHSEFFGMNITPSVDQNSINIEKMVGGVVRNGTINIKEYYAAWDSIKDWSIELDEALLVSNELNTTPEEITAILLHEIGHTVYSHAVPYRIMKVARTAIQNMNIRMRKIITWKPARKIMNVLFYQATLSKNFHNPLKEETEADKFVVQCGYGEHLKSFIDKLMTYEGNRLIDRTEADMLADVEIFVQWYVESLKELQYRSTKINKDLELMIKNSRSNTVIRALMKAKNNFVDNENRKFSYDQLLRGPESQVELSYALESVEPKNLYRKLTPVNLADIDMISIKIPNIETGSDQMYILDLIHYYINILNEAKIVLMDETYSRKVRYPLSPKQIDEYTEILQNLRKNVLAVKITPKDYRIIIDYPKGYEG